MTKKCPKQNRTASCNPVFLLLQYPTGEEIKKKAMVFLEIPKLYSVKHLIRGGLFC